MTPSGQASISLPMLSDAPLLDTKDAPRFWRSLDQLADSDEFRQWLEAEFPAAADGFLGAFSRRRFLKLMSASLALGGLTGCGWDRNEAIIPSVRPSEGTTPGEPLRFATTLTRDGFAHGVVVKSVSGRPFKIEGNPDHPASLGATDLFTQAEILSFYDPDRSQSVQNRGSVGTWEAFGRAWEERAVPLRADAGRGLRILTGPITSPTLIWQLDRLLKTLPRARWHIHDPLANRNVKTGTRLAFGRPVDWVYKLEQAERILSFDSDFLFDLPGSVRYARDFAQARSARHEQGSTASLNRLYVAEPTPTITGSKADHRLPAGPRQLELLCLRLATKLGLGVPGTTPTHALTPGQHHWIDTAAGDLLEHKGRSLVVAGRTSPAWMHALACAINQSLGNVGKTILPIQPIAGSTASNPGGLEELCADAAQGQVRSLVILGTNPAYTAPADLDFAAVLQQAEFTAHMGVYRDETALLCEWHLPQAHELETWSDARAFDATAGIIQPLIEPLYRGRSPHELMQLLAGEPVRPSRETVEAYWRDRLPSAGFKDAWRQALRDGIVRGTAAEPLDLTPRVDTIRHAIAEAEHPAIDTNLTLVIQPDPTVWDGRYANNAWLQEIPKPLSKTTWDNVVLISPQVAKRLNLQDGDDVRVSVGGGSAEGQACIMPGQAPDVVAMALGYGRPAAGRVGERIGADAYHLQSLAHRWTRPGAVLERLGRRDHLATTQNHHSMEGRDLFRSGSLDAFKKQPGRIGHPEGEHHRPSLYPEYAYEGTQWGMVIDLTKCIGCNACTVACQAENNIPVVGKDGVIRGREMHWIRIDRYFEHTPENPDIHHQPVPCMHCEKAPCELVCPVGATQHSQDGLNEMIYNRCIGTRYCSNNCPYKVRRFNFLRYTAGGPNMELLHNPEVTVRNRGVMEKCTYCVQRIRTAEIDARRDDRSLHTDEVVTACQQVCPTQAITFGDINDPASAVSRLRKQPHNYGMLAELNTQPRTTYLAEIRNPHPDLVRKAGPKEGKSG